MLVSIHAPPEGRDHDAGRSLEIGDDIVSIHAPPEGRDRLAEWAARPLTEFQSTRPRRGAISGRLSLFPQGYTVSIHAPPEGRDSLFG